MSLEPLLTAPPVIQAHAYAAAAALILGVSQIAGPKGTLPHKAMGVLWILLMAVIAGTSIFIGRPTEPGDPFWARFSPIHIFTVLTFGSLAMGVSLLLRGGPALKHHARPFIGLFLGGLILAGVLAVALPGRVMYRVVFGG